VTIFARLAIYFKVYPEAVRPTRSYLKPDFLEELSADLEQE